MQGQPTSFTMQLTGPAADQLARSGNSNQLRQALAALMPGISE